MRIWKNARVLESPMTYHLINTPHRQAGNTAVSSPLLLHQFVPLFIMATPAATAGKVKLDTIARSVVWLEKGKRSGNRHNLKKRRGISTDVSIEMSGLAEEALSRNPLELAKDGELDMLKALIEAMSLPFTFTDPGNGCSLLHAAASNNQVHVIQYLIDHNVSLNSTNNDGNTPLHVATTALAFDVIHLLLNHAVDDTILNDSHDAALHIAVRTGNVDLVNVFLQHEYIDLIVQGYRNRTPLHIAAELDLVDIAIAFNNAIVVTKDWKEKGSFRLCAVDSDNLTPIHFAARCGSANVLQYMISICAKHGYPPESVMKYIDEENSTPLHVAIDSGHVNVLKVLLQNGASPLVQNGDQIPPLHLACYQGRLEMVQLIVEHCGDDVIHEISKNGQTPLHWGSRSIHGRPVLQYLISKGAKQCTVDKQGQSALHYSVIFGSLEAAKELMKTCNDSIYVTDNFGRNVIHHAVLNNRAAIIRMLMLNLANAFELIIKHQDKSGHCPLHYALENNQDDILMSMISAIRSKIVNLKNKDGWNYLHISAKSGNWKALNVLLETPASSIMINEVDNKGLTPLHYAAINGQLRCIELLLSHGAMIHKCYAGYTPFLTAVKNGYRECAEVLFRSHPFQREWTDDSGNTGLQLSLYSGSECPSVLNLCLDLNIPINRNENGETFLDIIISKSLLNPAFLVIQHDRWQECLDYPVLEENEHPFLLLIKNFPAVAAKVLERCHKMCPLPRNHPNYYENYDFKYLRLDKEDLEENEKPEKEKNGGKMEKEEMEIEEMTEQDVMSEVSIKISRNRVADIGNAVIGGRRNQPLEAMKTMLICNRVHLLTHPVVIQYLKAKWRGYGRLVYGIQFFLFFLQVVLVSIFALITPPARFDVDDNTYELLSDNITLSDVSIASNTIRIVTLFTCSFNTFLLVITILSIGLKVINFTKYDGIWLLTLSMISTYSFLIPWKYSVYGFRFIYWEAGAIATFSSWFSLVIFVKPFDFFGVYVTMFTEVLSTLIKVLFMCFLFLVAFTFPFYILVGDAHPFTNFGDAMFITFSYILGEINYEYYVRRTDNGSLQHPNLTYIFIVVAAGILAVAVANFLIGLAVGDIDSIRRNAVVKQRSDEIRIFSRIDVWLPKFIVQKYNKRFHTVHCNETVSLVRRIWRHLWRAVKETQEEDKDMYKLLADQQSQLHELKLDISNQVDIERRRYDELKHLLQTVSNKLNNYTVSSDDD